MALRNIGRQSARTVSTLVALFIGIFAIGLVLVLGQNIQGQLSNALNDLSGANVLITATKQDKLAVDAALARANGISRIIMTTSANGTPVSINGKPYSEILTGITDEGQRLQTQFALSSLQGYDFANGQKIDTTSLTVTQGRLLNERDAGTNNIVLSDAATRAPLNLKLGDRIAMNSDRVEEPITLNVVGFYSTTGAITLTSGVQADVSVLSTLTQGNVQYDYGLRIDSDQVNSTVATLRSELPNVQILTLSDLVAQVTTLLNNLILLLQAIASLAMFAGIIIIANTVTLAMLERRRELGILKSFGHTSDTILGEVLIENGLVGFLGSLLAMLVVATVATVLGTTLFNLSFTISTVTVLGVIGIATIICMAVATLVAWNATRVRPLEVLRYE
jgi:ABC-type antimicrobial peptide transport system permease subunit